jgi:hypothetical protein
LIFSKSYRIAVIDEYFVTSPQSLALTKIGNLTSTATPFFPHSRGRLCHRFRLTEQTMPRLRPKTRAKSQEPRANSYLLAYRITNHQSGITNQQMRSSLSSTPLPGWWS